MVRRTEDVESFASSFARLRDVSRVSLAMRSWFGKLAGISWRTDG